MGAGGAARADLCPGRVIQTSSLRPAVITLSLIA